MDLKRHKARVTKCDSVTTTKKYRCVCEKEYSDRHSLYRHRKACARYAGTLVLADTREQNLKKLGPAQEKKVEPTSLAAPVVVQNITNTIQHIQVNTLGHHQQVSVAPAGQIGGPTVVAGVTGGANTAVGHNATIHGVSDPLRLPGWPAKWPAPPILPSPFKPLGFEISQPELEAAVGSLTSEERASCAKGDTLGVSRLLVEILKRVHSDPKERNVYLNPSRSDQALVFIPSSWSAQPLEEATQALFARIRAQLEGVDKGAERSVRSAVSGARRGCEGRLPQLARASRAQLSAHLENVRRATASGEDWLGTGGEQSDQPAFIGKEMAGHLVASMLAPALEQASGVYALGDVTEDTARAQVSRALAECARYILHSRPTNLTVLEADGLLYAHEREAGWVLWDQAQAAEALLRRTAWVLNNELHDIPGSPLVALRPWLCERLPEVLSSQTGREAGERVLWHYTQAAARYYGALPRVQDPHDRRESARRLLAGEPPCVAYEPPAAQALAMEGGPMTDALTEEDLAELLGW